MRHCTWIWLVALLVGCSRGVQPTALILVSAPGAPPHPYADKAVTASLFYSSTNAGSARSFFLESSYGQMTIVGANGEGTANDVYGPFTTANNVCSNFGAIALADPVIDYSKYLRVVVLVNNPACVGGGVSTPNLVTHSTGEGEVQLTESTILNLGFGDTVLNGKIGNTTVHEYGHAIGMSHAGAWYCGNASVSANGCYGSAYVEPIDLVSQGSSYAHPNSVHKALLKWLPGARLATASASGSYTLHAYEDGNDNLKVLRVPRKLPSGAGDPLGFYYLSYRRPTPPWDTWVAQAPKFVEGVSVHTDERGYGFETGLLDVTPGSSPGLDDITDGALLLKQKFVDDLTGVSIAVTGVTPEAATVSVVIPPRKQRFVQLTMEPTAISNVVMSGVGSVSGGGVYNGGQSVSLSATALPGWGFAGWWAHSTDVPTLVSMSNPHTLVIAGDVVIAGRFVPAPPPNDNFSSATTVTLPVQFSLFTAGANQEIGEAFPANICGPHGAHGRTIWYRYTPKSNQRLTVDTHGSDGAADIAVYTGNSVAALSPVPGACALHDAGPRAVTFTAAAGTTYRIQIDTSGGNTAATFAAAPPNDDFAAAKVLAAPTKEAVSLRGASVEAGEDTAGVCGGLFGIQVSAWYAFTPAAAATLTLSATYGGAKEPTTTPVVRVFTGSTVSNLVPVAGTCTPGPNNSQTEITVPVTPGTQYFIRVGHFRKNIDPTKATTMSFTLQEPVISSGQMEGLPKSKSTASGFEDIDGYHVIPPAGAMSETVMLHVACVHCGQKLTLQFVDWPETMEAATKPQTRQSWACPACMKLNSGEFPAKLGWVWKGHRTAPSR